MNNFIILTPTFNDWRSLSKLLLEIDKNIRGLKGKFKVLIINRIHILLIINFKSRYFCI